MRLFEGFCEVVVRKKFVRSSILASVASLSVGCASLGNKPSQVERVQKEEQRQEHTKSSISNVQKVYPVPSAIHADRLKEIRGSSLSSQSSTSAQESIQELGTEKPRPLLQTDFPIFESLVRSERWNDVLADSEAQWSECLSNKSLFSRRCRELGRARAVAYVRLGHSDSAWGVQDQLAMRGSDSEDALVFAGLYLDVGATGLCVQLTTTALQWEPIETRRALWALRSKCLRMSERINDARSVVRLGLTEFPLDNALMLESAFVAFGENNLTQGCDILEQLHLKKSRQVAVSYNWAHCLIRRRDAEEASKVIAAGRQDWPMERAWLILSGELALLSGRVEQARQFGFDYLSGSDVRDPLRAQAERLTRVVTGGER